MSFESLGLSAAILRAVQSEGYTTPTPIQAAAIPIVLEGRDMLGCAQTGTGKTAAFALPLLHRLAAAPAAHKPGEKRSRGIRALILSPTRELASQIFDCVRAYGRHLPLRSAVIFGGVNQSPQVQALRAGAEIVVATPGRLLDLFQQGFVNLRGVETFVLDEADRMLDLGFMPDIRRIVSQLPRERQTLMFSATMPADIRQLADSILRHPENVHVSPTSSTADRIEQAVYLVAKRNKPALLKHLLKASAISRALVFTRTKHGADRVVKDLIKAGIRAAAIHGNKSQAARTKALDGFRSAAVPILVATDIASRGIDVDDISHVFNFDVPHEAETYVHRIGRTARAGASGKAVTFCDHDERSYFRDIERLIRQKIGVLADGPAFPREAQPAVAPAEERRGRPGGHKPFAAKKGGGKPAKYKFAKSPSKHRRPKFKKKAKGTPVASGAPA